MARTLIEKKKVSILKFLDSIQTSSKIEERIQLMIEDKSIKVISFENGSLRYKTIDNTLKEVTNWKLSLFDTLEFLTKVAEVIGSNYKYITLTLQDKVVYFEFNEDTSIKDLEKRLLQSDFEFTIQPLSQNEPFLPF